MNTVGDHYTYKGTRRVHCMAKLRNPSSSEHLSDTAKCTYHHVHLKQGGQS